MRSLKLYRVFVGGAVYWMSLDAHELDVAGAANSLLQAAGEDELASKVEEMPESETARIHVWDPNAGDDRTLTVWQMHLLAKKPVIHGCSEWP